jgi:hypothetical protein
MRINKFDQGRGMINRFRIVLDDSKELFKAVSRAQQTTSFEYFKKLNHA